MARTASRRRRSSLAGKRPGGGSAAPFRLLLALGRGPGRRGERDGIVVVVSEVLLCRWNWPMSLAVVGGKEEEEVVGPIAGPLGLVGYRPARCG
jgi:hypothetical protein